MQLFYAQHVELANLLLNNLFVGMVCSDEQVTAQLKAICKFIKKNFLNLYRNQFPFTSDYKQS